MSKPVQIQLKDPDALYAADLTEEERKIIMREYAEYGEYFMVEIDFAGKVAKLLPLAEWPDPRNITDR